MQSIVSSFFRWSFHTQLWNPKRHRETLKDFFFCRCMMNMSNRQAILVADSLFNRAGVGPSQFANISSNHSRFRIAPAMFQIVGIDWLHTLLACFFSRSYSCLFWIISLNINVLQSLHSYCSLFMIHTWFEHFCMCSGRAWDLPGNLGPGHRLQAMLRYVELLRPLWIS